MTRQDGAPPLPDLVLWRRDGCHLCDETSSLLQALFVERERSGRPAPRVVERRIDEDPAIERALFEQIPVLEVDGRRLPLAISPGPIRAFVAAAYDGVPA